MLYNQLADGYRTGIEPVLLAAAVPARPGERVVEGGTGAGAGLLCLAARVPGLLGSGVEIDTALVEVARGNIAANGYAGLAVHHADLEEWDPGGVIDHAFANPPWYDPAGTVSPIPGRRRAKLAAHGLLERWTASLGTGLRKGGTLSLILPASSLPAGYAALTAAGCPQISLFPLWSRAGHRAKLAVMCGIRGGNGASVVLPGLVLHEDDGRFTEAAENVLRHGAGLLPT